MSLLPALEKKQQANNKLISVLIRTFNRPMALAKAVDSVLKQTYRPLEIVLVNDGGEAIDPALQVLAAVQQVQIRQVDLPSNQGRSVAANTALKTAQGAAFIFLDDDDWFAPNHLAKLWPVLQANPQLSAVYSDTACVLSATDLTVQKVFDYEFDLLRLAYENYLPIHSVLFTNNAFSQACEFNPKLDVYEDWNFWVQLAAKAPMQRVPGVTAWYSAQLGGLGFSAFNQNFSAEEAAFFKQSLPFYKNEQINALLFMCRSFFSVSQTNKQQEATIAHQQQQLAEFQVGIRAELNQLNEKYFAVRTFKQLKRGLDDLPLVGKVKRKAKTLWLLVKEGDWQAIKTRMLRNLNNLNKKLGVFSQAAFLGGSLAEVGARGVTILCTSHTLFVAELLKQQLEAWGLTVNSISDEEPQKYDNTLYLMICAQQFKRLPSRYLVFQMEQSVSTRWFDARYMAILKKADAILDYSKANLAYLQQQGVPFEKLYYLPISNLPATAMPNLQAVAPVYDVVFYGDANSPRRQAFLEAISKRFKTLLVSEVFGEDLYHQLKQAKVLVNIHYYEGALLETTRIYEALSLGLTIVSEVSVDQLDHAVLDPWVTFTPTGDIDALLVAIQSQLDKPTSLANLTDDLAGANFHLGRMLVGLGLLGPQAIAHFPLQLSKQALQAPLCLSMPESYQRHAEFRAKHPTIQLFHGLRFNPSWIGCALSYTYLAKQALKQGVHSLEIWEDDVVLTPAALARWQVAKALFIALESTPKKCDLISGLLADVADETQVLDCFEEAGQIYVVIDRMVSAVCNFYGKNALGYLANWDVYNQDAHQNTIDRYLEKKDLRILVPLPFVAGHNPDQDSTLWGCQNSEYDSLIAASEAKLTDKLQRFKQQRTTNGGVG